MQTGITFSIIFLLLPAHFLASIWFLWHFKTGSSSLPIPFPSVRSADCRLPAGTRFACQQYLLYCRANHGSAKLPGTESGELSDTVRRQKGQKIQVPLMLYSSSPEFMWWVRRLKSRMAETWLRALPLWLFPGPGGGRGSSHGFVRATYGLICPVIRNSEKPLGYYPYTRHSMSVVSSSHPPREGGWLWRPCSQRNLAK